MVRVTDDCSPPFNVKKNVKIGDFFLFFLAGSCILNPPLDPQSGCRRQCLGVGAKTVETLGLSLGLFNSFSDSVVSKNLCFYGGEGGGQ